MRHVQLDLYTVFNVKRWNLFWFYITMLFKHKLWKSKLQLLKYQMYLFFLYWMLLWKIVMLVVCVQMVVLEEVLVVYLKLYYGVPVMGIKGRRVHMIEELSDTIISFQRGMSARCRLFIVCALCGGLFPLLSINLSTHSHPFKIK